MKALDEEERGILTYLEMINICSAADFNSWVSF